VVLEIPHLRRSLLEGGVWQDRSREPFLLETSLSGVFAAGDVRGGSIKRCTSAVGEGSMAVRLVHQYLGRNRRVRKAHGFVATATSYAVEV
jgi:thioredoxin reductase (NADPH)